MKKIIALTLAFVIMMSFVDVSEGADLSNTSYAKAATVLIGLGILPDGDELENTPLTRADAASLLAGLLASESEVSSFYNDNVVYTDVDTSHQAAEAIYFMTARGILKGYGDRTFRPDNEVLVQEFIKCLVSVLGYAPKAELSGGYPTGYLITASNLKMLNDISINADAPITKDDAVWMIYNILETPIASLAAINAEEESITVNENVNILSRYFDTYKGEGVFKADAYISVSESATTVGDGQILIDDTLYLFNSDIDLSEQYGMYLEFYYTQKKNSNVKTVIYAASKYYDGHVLEIDSDSILPDTSKNTLVYENQQSKIQKITIPQHADIVYNNSFYTKAMHLLPGDLLMDIGSVRLIDNDGNGSYDLIFIYSYDTHIVDKISRSDNVIYLKGQSLPIDLSNTLDCKFLKDGQESALSYLKEWNVLSVLRDKSGVVRQINISDKLVHGIVTEIISSATGDIYVIDSQEYKLSPHFDTAKNKSAGIGSNLALYLDIFGDVAITDSLYNPSKYYGYLMQIQESNDITGDFNMKIYNSDDQLVIHSLAKNIELDGAQMKTSPEFFAVLKDMLMQSGVSEDGQSGKGLCQIISYEINTNNQITKLDTVYPNVVPGEDDLRKDYSLNDSTNEKDWRRYQKNGRTFVIGKKDTGFMMDDMVIVFIVPYSDKTDESLYSVVNMDFFTNESYYNLEAYNVSNDTNMATVIVYQDNVAGTGAITEDTTPIMLVDKVSRVRMGEEDLFKVYGWISGKYDFFYADEQTKIETWNLRKYPADVSTPVLAATGDYLDVAQGDLLVFSKNSQNKVKKIVRWLPSLETAATTDNQTPDINQDTTRPSIKTDTPFAYEPATYNDKIFGSVEKCNSKVITVCVEDGKYNYNTETVRPNIYKFDVSKAKTELATLNDVLPGQKVFVRARFGELKEIIIYSNL